MRSLVALATVFATALLGAAFPASAATKTWTGGGGNSNWSTTANWSPSGAPAAGDTVVFNSAVTTNADLASGIQIAAIQFGTNSAGSIINGTIRISANSATSHNVEDLATSTAVVTRIDANMILSNGTTWLRSVTPGHVLEIRGTMSRGDTQENGVLIYGPGTVKFNHNTNNSYLGVTTVATADGFGANGLLQLAGNATSVIPGDFVVGTSSTASSAPDRPQAHWLISSVIADTSKVTVGADGLLALGINNETIAQLSGSGSVTSTGTFSVLTVGDVGNFTWGGVISGPGAVNKVGTGSMTYTAANTYTGTTTVSGGTLVLNAPLLGTAQAIKGPLTIGLGVGTVTTATVQLANNFQIDSTTSPININSDGQLDAGGFLDAVGPTTINGGKFTIGGNVQQFGGLTMAGGTISGVGSLELRASNVVATSTVALGASTINVTVELGFATDTITVNSGSTQPELTVNGTVQSGVPVALIKTGTGTLRLAGTTANSYGGSTTVERGTMELAKPDSVGAITGPIIIGNFTDPAGSATLKNLASNQLIGKPEVTLNPSGVYQVSNSAVGIRTETIGKLRGSGKLFLPFRPELTIDFDSGFPAFSGPIDSPSPNGDGSRRINKRGGGVQIFSFNTTTYDGTLVVYAGSFYVEGQMPNAPVSIQGGLVGGSGRVADVDVGSNVAATPSTLAPGSAVGNVLTTGAAAFSFGPSARLHIDLPSSTPGTHGRLSVTGAFRPGDNDGGSLYVNPVGNPTPTNGTVFEIVTKTSVGPVTGIFPGLPEGRSVYMGARNGKISYVGGDGNDVTLTVAPTLDIDGDSRYLPETDGLLIARFIRGLTGPALTQGAVAISGGARRTIDSDILNYLNGLGNLLNVDQVSTVNNNDALLILRWLFGYRDVALVAGLPLPPGMNAIQFADTVRNQIEQLTP